MSKDLHSGEGPQKPLQPDGAIPQKKKRKHANLTTGPAGEYLAEHVRQWNSGELSRLKSVRELEGYLFYQFGVDARHSGIAKRLNTLGLVRDRATCIPKSAGEDQS